MEKFCDAFPLSDIIEIILKLLDVCVANATNLRAICKGMDSKNTGVFNRARFVEMLDFVFQQVKYSMSMSNLGLKCIYIYFSILVASCLMWSGALDSYGALHSYSIKSLT